MTYRDIDLCRTTVCNATVSYKEVKTSVGYNVAKGRVIDLPLLLFV